MNAIFEIAHEPIDRLARRVANDRAFDCASEQDLESLIVTLMERQGALRMEQARIDGDLQEANERYHAYGVCSPPGWFVGRKLEKERVNQEAKRLGNAIDCLRRRLGARRLGRLGEAFLAVAREHLAVEVYHDLLRRAETAVVVAVKNTGTMV